MDTHDDRDFEKGGAAEPESDDPTRREQAREAGDKRERREERSGSGCGSRERHRRHRRHRRHHRHGGRKERVLHTRVSEQLSEDIRRLADDLRVPASNLVRNVLEEVFTVVENVSDDMGGLFEDLVEEAEGARDRLRERERRGRRRSRSRRRTRRDFDDDVEAELRDDEREEASDREDDAAAASREPDRPDEPAFPDVLGWQPLVLNHARVCARCGAELSRGHRGFIGVTANGLSDIMLCRSCVGT